MTRLRRAIPLVGYVVVLLAAYYPESIRPHDTVGPLGDSLESTYLVAWNVHTLFGNPLDVYNTTIYCPATRALTYTDHRFLPSLVAAPVLWMTTNPILAYNAAVVVGLLFAAMAARRLGLSLGLDAAGAWAAGALYAFNTTQIASTPRLQIIWHGFIPLALEQMVVLLRTGDRRAAWRLAALLLLQGLCANYLLLYAVLLLGIVAAGAMVVRPKETLRSLAKVCLPGAVALLLFLPVAIPYAEQTLAQGLGRALAPGIDLGHLFKTLPTNLVYGPLLPDLLPVRRPNFVGFVSLGLAAAALALWARRREAAGGEQLPARVWVPCAAALLGILILLSLGRDVVVFGKGLGPGPYGLLYRWLPGFKLVRFPERFILLAMLFLGLLAGRAVMLVRRAGYRVLALVLAVLLPLEHVSPGGLGFHRFPVWGDVPAVYRWLKDQTVGCLVDIPTHRVGDLRMETVPMYFSTYNFRRMLNGYAGYVPPGNEALRETALTFPAGDSVNVLRRAGVDTILLHLPPRGVLAEYDRLAPAARVAFADHFERLCREGRAAEERAAVTDLCALAPPHYYRRLQQLEASAALVRMASFQGPTTRLPGGEDVVYRIGPPVVRP